MDSYMEIELEFYGNAFKARATIVPDAAIAEKSFSFILNNELLISEILCNKNKVCFEKVSEERPNFRPISQKISFQSNEKINEIIIKYSGSVAFSFEKLSCWHNIITEDIKSLNWYSVWYPQETSIKIDHDKVKLINAKDYFLVKGIFDKDKNIWEYGGKGYDPYNIMAYRKEALKTLSNSFMNIYFVDNSIKAHAEKLESLYCEILDFYNGNLFERKEIPVLDIACASPAIKFGGGYRRKDFMWYTSLGDNDMETARIIAHETAHIWCSGADCNSWEDWLNETTAEWAVMLFALHKKDSSLFDFILKPKLEKNNSLPSIKTPDGTRPDGVHDKGCVLFYEIYKLFGVEAVCTVLRTFTDLKDKNTAALLQNLYTEGKKDIADFIKQGIIS